jgi:hypothetical protein
MKREDYIKVVGAYYDHAEGKYLSDGRMQFLAKDKIVSIIPMSHNSMFRIVLVDDTPSCSGSYFTDELEEFKEEV